LFKYNLTLGFASSTGTELTAVSHESGQGKHRGPVRQVPAPLNKTRLHAKRERQNMRTFSQPMRSQFDRAGANHLSGSSVLGAFGQRVDNAFFDSLAGALRPKFRGLIFAAPGMLQ
jgi:hypothetical protein